MTQQDQEAAEPPEEWPEHAKLEAVKNDSQAIGAFLDFGGYVLCVVEDNEYVPVYLSIERVLARYFEIDLDVLDGEKRAMLDRLRAAA